MTRDALEMAQACADAMWADDKASRAMGMQIEKVGPGFAVLSMSVNVDMVNGHGLCHGGYIFSLADAALAFACNSHNQRHVTSTARSPTWLQVCWPRPGSATGASGGIYDVTVRTEDGETAEFRGQSRSIPCTLIAEA